MNLTDETTDRELRDLDEIKEFETTGLSRVGIMKYMEYMGKKMDSEKGEQRKETLNRFTDNVGHWLIANTPPPEIGGQKIDNRYGDWLNLNVYHEATVDDDVRKLQGQKRRRYLLNKRKRSTVSK